MKKLTLYSGIIAVLIILVGVIMESLHWPGAGVTLTLGVALFVGLYAVLFFLDRHKLASSNLQKLLNLGVLKAMVLFPLGFLFKMMHWPWAGAIIYLGNLVLVLLIPVILVKASKEANPVKRMNSFNEAIVLTFVIAFLIILTFNR